MKAIIVWHYYEDGKIIGYSITEFTGNNEELLNCLENDASGKPRNKDKKIGEVAVILHQVIFL